MSNKDLHGNQEFVCLDCKKNVEAYNTFRFLWQQYCFWTRAFMVSSSYRLQDFSYVKQRYLRVPNDFSNTLSEFYSKEQAELFSGYLREHIVISSRIVDYAKSGSLIKASMERKVWYNNAELMAKTLSTMNTKLSQNKWNSIIFEHIQVLEDIAIMRFKNRFSEENDQFDKLLEQVLYIADTMAEGIMT